MAENFHLGMSSTDDLIDEVQRRGMTVVPGGGERAKGQIVVRADDDPKPGFGLTISRLQEIVFAWAKGKGWWDDPQPNVPEKIALMHSELSEALEDYRGNRDLKEITFEGPDHKPCGFPTEMADTVIRIADFCGRFGIDLERAILIKHAYNADRPHRHGGKAC